MRKELPAHGQIGYLRALARFFRDPKASTLGKLFVLATVVYVVSPVDFVPDVAPIIGWLDDLGLAGVAIAYLARVLGPYRLAPVATPPVITTTGWPSVDAYAVEPRR